MTAQTQSVPTQRSAGLKAIVFYKGLIVLVLIAISLISAMSWRRYDQLVELAQTNLADGEFTLMDWFLKTVLHSQVADLRQLARLTGVYGVVMGIATVGLWYGKKWANPLMVLIVGLPLPIETQELLHEPSGKRLTILLLNLAVFGFLIKKQIGKAQAEQQPATN